MAENKGLEKSKAPENKDVLKQKATLSEDVTQKVMEGIEMKENLKGDFFLSKLDKKDRTDIGKTLKLDSDLTSEKLKQISTMDLLRAEKEKNGSLMLLFGEKIEKEGKERRTFKYNEFEVLDEKGKRDTEKSLEKFDKSFNVGDRILVDFKGNMDAHWNIGAGDMLPETVRKVSIFDNEGKKRTSTIRQGLRGGFFDKDGYMPVFSGYIIVIGGEGDDKDEKSVWSNTELADYKKNQAEREKEELAHLDRIYKENSGASRGKMQKLEDVFEKPDLARLGPTMDKAMERFGIGPEFKPVLYSFIKHESSFIRDANPKTSSAYGLFQLLESNWEWTYRELTGKRPSDDSKEYNNFKKSLEGQVYSGILYFKKMDLAPVKNALGRRVDPNNMRDNYLLYIAHHDGPGGLRSYLRNGYSKHRIEGYAWKVANGAEFYKQELARRAAGKNAPKTEVEIG